LLADAREQTDKLFSVIRTGFLYERPVPERHRLIFYLGHVDAFDWNQIGRFHLHLPSFHPTFDKLFEAGIDPEVGNAPRDVPSDWPRLEEIHAYCKRARAQVDSLLVQADPDVVQMAIEHRLMHAETLAYLLHQLPFSQKCAPAIGDARDTDARGPRKVDIPGGSVTLGRDRDQGFGWDNEFSAHQVKVDSFCIDRWKVTNGDYLEFVKQGARPPAFWMEIGGKWYYRGMFSPVPLPLRWPVYVTHEEALAYARWKGKKLPTEPQFHRAAYGTRGGAEHEYPWGDSPPARIHGNFHFESWDPIPVGALPAGDSDFRISQLVGNGWEWTSTVFAPFPGFRPHPTYPGYSSDFFDGQHYVLKGASPRTARLMLRRSFRNWFRPNYPYVYATFRCVED
jgi:formylglycine-generating enzyme required for sulfatase activity